MKRKGGEDEEIKRKQNVFKTQQKLQACKERTSDKKKEKEKVEERKKKEK